MDLTLQDLIVRLQLTTCKYGELSNIFANDLKWGRKCAKSEWKDLILLNVYIELLEDYNIDSDNNCITSDELNTMLDNIINLLRLKFPNSGILSFPPPGFTYIPIPELAQFDDSWDDSWA